MGNRLEDAYCHGLLLYFWYFGLLYAANVLIQLTTKPVYGDFIPKALATEKYIAAPESYVVGKGLENIQAGLDLVGKGGVSAKKVVITL